MFSASKHREREEIGDRTTDFLEWVAIKGGQVLDYQVRQSSDHAFHCISIILFYYLPPGA